MTAAVRDFFIQRRRPVPFLATMSEALGSVPSPTRTQPQQPQQAVVIDLCGDDEGSLMPAAAGRNGQAALGVARMPTPQEPIELLDDDDEVVFQTPKKWRCRSTGRVSDKRSHETFFDVSEIISLSPERKIFRRCRHDGKRPASRQKRELGRLKDSSGTENLVSEGLRKSTPRVAVVAKMPTPVVDLRYCTVNAAAVQTPVFRSPLDKVLEVFPDVHPDYARSLLQQHDGNPATVGSLLAEGSYPKSKTSSSSVADGGVVLHRAREQSNYDFMVASSFQPTNGYTTEAQAQLLRDFPFASVSGSRKLLNDLGKGHYAIAHDAICQAIMGGVLSKDSDKREKQYRRLKSAISGVPLTSAQHSRLRCGTLRMTILSPRKRPKDCSVTNAILLEEISYVKRKELEWMQDVHLRLARKQNRAAAEKAGTTMECPCCCFDVAVDEMIACRDEGHLFCVDCLRRFAENQIFAQSSFGTDPRTKKPATDLLCMHSDGCSSGFHIAHLRKALPDKIMAKYDELQYRVAIDAAGIELFSCPKCGLRAELPPSQMIFHCPDADCGLETCRNCGEPAHIPLKCSEVEKAHETKGRLKVEEAITAAKIRTCPKPGCGKKFVKEDGCNKMTCPSCSTWSCYICRALIPRNVSYAHFCQTAHCQHQACKKCPLYSKVEEDDKRAMREAGLQAAEEVRGERLPMPAGNGNPSGVAATPAEVRVDVDSLLKDVPAPVRRHVATTRTAAPPLVIHRHYRR